MGTSTRPLTARRVVACVLAVLSGYIAYAVYSQAARGHDIDATAQALAAQNAVLQQHIADDHSEIAQAQTNGWLAEQARRLGYVLPGENVYVLVTPGAAALPPGGGVDARLPTLATPAPTPTPAPTATVGPSAAPTPTPTPTPYSFSLPQPTPGH